MRKNLVLTPIAMILVSGAISMSAQDTTGTLAGRVTSQDGRSLQGVHIQINSPSLLNARQAVTDAGGQFRLPLLPGGDYSIVYTLNGYLTRRLSIRVNAGQTYRADMQLRSIDAQEVTVEIVASSQQQVDKTETVVATTMSQQKLLDITGGVNVGNVLALAAGAYSAGNNYAVRGGTQSGMRLTVDGADITNNAEGTAYGVRMPLTDAIESIAVLQSPKNARYGNSDGGLVNIVLSKGSNDFRGSIRTSPNRGNIWNASNVAYPNAFGEVGVFNPGNDNLSKSHQFFVSGPLWKNRVTFSWSGQHQPTTRNEIFYRDALSGLWPDGYTMQYPERYRTGTYYRDPGTGAVIRKAEMLEANDPLNSFGRWSVRRDDTFTLFWQITQNHQLEYTHTQYEEGDYNTNSAAYRMADTIANPYVASDSGGNQRRWTMSYKGIIGTSGVLEARIARSEQLWRNLMLNGNPKYNVLVKTMPSLYPINPNGDLSDPNNYYASGFIDAFLRRNDGIKNTNYEGASNISGVNFSEYSYYATNQGYGDGGINEPWFVNYQHILDTKSGQHIIDVGVQREKGAWANPNLYAHRSTNGERRYFSPGRIAADLSTPGAVLGYNGDYSQFAGKFIVFNMRYATLNSVDPYGLTRFNTGTFTTDPTDPNMLFTAWNNNTGYMRDYWPAAVEKIGSVATEVYTQFTSYYINDLWTINDNHSVMAGVRFDQFKVAEGDYTIHEYSLPTFRFEYKWDISGNQKRVVNLGFSQFHNMPNVSNYAAFFRSHIREWLWDSPSPLGATDGRPFLVTEAQMFDMNNYGYLWEEVISGPMINEVESGLKNLVTNEFEAGIRLNLDNGGSVRIAYINRSWKNNWAYVYNGWKDNPVAGGAPVYSRIMKNYDHVIGRSYNSIELEWDIPVTKQLEFGGSYTFARLIRNDLSEQENPQKTPNKTVRYWEYIFDQYDFPHHGPLPSRLYDREHRLAAYMNYDLTYGKVRSNLAFRFTYNSGEPYVVGYTYRAGYPVVPGLNDNRAGVGMPSPSNATLARDYTDNLNIHKITIDSWSTDLQYNLDVPLVSKLRWFANINISNPFNHRGITWSPAYGSSATLLPETVYNPNGTVAWEANNGQTGGPFRQNRGFNTGGLFSPASVQGRRTISLSTGLRF